MPVELPKGTRDINPEKKIIRDKVVGLIKKNFEKYGFVPLETPTFERLDVLTSKYAGGEEILKEIFSFKDQGDRKLGLRYDLTVPMCRFVALHPTIKLPFKRYAIDKVYRDGPIKRGRYREFYQCDADIVGSKSMLADFICLQIAGDIFKELKLDIEMQVNNRKLLNGIMKDSGVSDDNINTVILSIDKLEKMGKDYVIKEIIEKGIEKSVVDKIFNFIEITKLDDINLQSEEGNEGKKELKELFNYLDGNYKFNPSLARGLAYYTSTVFEGFLQKDLSNVAVFGGGRYDNMIGKFIGGNRDFPAVGISFGLEVISEILEIDKKTITDVFIVPVGDVIKNALELSKELRNAGFNVDMDIMDRGISKNLNYVNSLGIPYAIIIGETEINKQKYQLRDMKSGEQKELSIEDLKNEIKKS